MRPRVGRVAVESGAALLHGAQSSAGNNVLLRACGQDNNDTSRSCGNTLSFKTLAGTSYLFDREWGTAGAANGQFKMSAGVSTDALETSTSPTSPITGSRSSHRRAASSRSGDTGTGDGQFFGPTGVSVDPSGNVFVADSGNNRVSKFNSWGGFLLKWGTSGSSNGQFNAPRESTPPRAASTWRTETTAGSRSSASWGAPHHLGHLRRQQRTAQQSVWHQHRPPRGRLRRGHEQQPDPEVHFGGRLRNEVGHQRLGQRPVLSRV